MYACGVSAVQQTVVDLQVLSSLALSLTLLPHPRQTALILGTFIDPCFMRLNRMHFYGTFWEISGSRERRRVGGLAATIIVLEAPSRLKFSLRNEFFCQILSSFVSLYSSHKVVSKNTPIVSIGNDIIGFAGPLYVMRILQQLVLLVPCLNLYLVRRFGRLVGGMMTGETSGR